jgi:hypothetical protein
MTWKLYFPTTPPCSTTIPIRRPQKHLYILFSTALFDLFMLIFTLDDKYLIFPGWYYAWGYSYFSYHVSCFIKMMLDEADFIIMHMQALLSSLPISCKFAKKCRKIKPYLLPICCYLDCYYLFLRYFHCVDVSATRRRCRNKIPPQYAATHISAALQKFLAAHATRI